MWNGGSRPGWTGGSRPGWKCAQRWVLRCASHGQPLARRRSSQPVGLGAVSIDTAPQGLLAGIGGAMPLSSLARRLFPLSLERALGSPPQVQPGDGADSRGLRHMQPKRFPAHQNWQRMLGISRARARGRPHQRSPTIANDIGASHLSLSATRASHCQRAPVLTPRRRPPRRPRRRWVTPLASPPRRWASQRCRQPSLPSY